MVILRYAILICGMMFIFFPFFVQNKLYYPSKQHFGVDVEYEDVFLQAEEDILLNAWYSPPQGKELTVLFCHGNGGNLTFYKEIFKTLQEQGYGVMAIDYRGYGKSDGNPSEKGLYADARAAVQYLRKEKATLPEDIVIWGLSLGGAVAAQVASEGYNFRGVILQSTFTSVRGAASNVLHKAYFGVKSSYRKSLSHKLIQKMPVFEKFDTINKIHKIKSPVLIAHAQDDNIIPVHMSRELGKINPKNQVFISRKGGHNDYEWFYPRLFRFLNSLEKVKN